MINEKFLFWTLLYVNPILNKNSFQTVSYTCEFNWFIAVLKSWIERFHVTSRPPYLVFKTKGWQPYWYPEPIIRELNYSFLYTNIVFWLNLPTPLPSVFYFISRPFEWRGRGGFLESAFQSTSNRVIEVEYHINWEFHIPEYKLLVGQNHEFKIFETCVFFKFKMDATSSEREQLSSSLTQSGLKFESGKCLKCLMRPMAQRGPMMKCLKLLFMKSFVWKNCLIGLLLFLF